MADASLRLTLSERLARHAARAAAALPPAAQVRLSRMAPIRMDGQALAPDMQLALSLFERHPEADQQTVTAAEMRLRRRRLARVVAGRPDPVGAVADLQIDAEFPLRARHYAPPDAGPSEALLVYFHGGGFTYGDLDTHDEVCRLLSAHASTHVLSVDYRLAPEHPFPAAVEDARAALSWAHLHAHELGADPEMIGVGGDSAGGNLAAVTSQLAARDGGPAPVLQLLVYPATDCTSHRRSRRLFGERFFLTEEQMNWFETNYLGSVGGADGRDPRASPLLAEDLSGLPAAIVVTAGFDPLRDEGEEYAKALRAAGTPALLRRFPDLVHGFLSVTGLSRACRDAAVEIAGATRAMFAASRTPDGQLTVPGSAATPAALRF